MMFLKFLTMPERLAKKFLIKNIHRGFFVCGWQELTDLSYDKNWTLKEKSIYFSKRILMSLFGLNLCAMILSTLICIGDIFGNIEFLTMFGASFFSITVLLYCSLTISIILLDFYEKTDSKSIWIFIIFSMIAMLCSIVYVLLCGFTIYPLVR